MRSTEPNLAMRAVAEYVTSKTISNFCTIRAHVWVSRRSFTEAVCRCGSRGPAITSSAANVRPVTFGSNTDRTRVS